MKRTYRDGITDLQNRFGTTCVQNVQKDSGASHLTVSAQDVEVKNFIS